MAADEQTGEEKKLPPSSTKLRQLRKRGKVAHSRDFVAAIVTIGLLIALLAIARSTTGDLQAYLGSTLDRLPDRDLLQPADNPGWMFLRVVVPIFAVACLLILLANMVDAQGFVFTTEGIAPNFGKLNPMAGLKRLVELRTLSELLKSLIKVALVIPAAVGIMALTLNAALWAPTCGAGCSLTAFAYTIGGIAGLGCIILILFGFGDLLISRALFRHEQKMTQSEAKRDHKESEGDPVMKRGRRDFAMNSDRAPPSLASVAGPTLWIDSGRQAVGLYYDQGLTAAPMITTKVEGASRVQALALARTSAVPVFVREELARELYTSSNSGQYIPARFHDRVAEMIVRLVP